MTGERQVERVVVLALDGVYPFELGIPSRIFGAADGRYEVLTCTVDGQPVRTNADFTIACRARTRDPGHGRHGRRRLRDALAHPHRAAGRSRRRARADPPGRTDRLHLHRRLRARRGRSPRRPQGHHALARGRPVPAHVPARRPRSGRAVRRRRPRPHLGRSRLRRRRLPAHRPHRPRQRTGQPGRPPLRGAPRSGTAARPSTSSSRSPRAGPRAPPPPAPGPWSTSTNRSP